MSDGDPIRVRTCKKTCATHMSSPGMGTFACNCGAFTLPALTEQQEKRVREIAREVVRAVRAAPTRAR
jgi:tRNA(Ile2) C34 agmatinyltransferase TiaS